MGLTSSLLISTYNWPTALELVLKSVLLQSKLPNEVIIADDGSTEDTKILINRYKSLLPIPLHHVWHPDKGFRKTIIMNKAINVASGDYIIQIDGDIILHPHFISDHLKNAEHNYFIKGSRAMLNMEFTQKLIKSGNVNINPLGSGVRSKINGTYLPRLSSLFYGSTKKTNDLRGCNFAFWKKDFIKVNGYNNNLIGWGHEDIELAARMVNSGLKRKQLKLSAVCFHLYHKINSRKRQDTNYMIYKNVVHNKISVCTNGYRQTLMKT
ncbi:glycosyltransferase family 2 protein [Desertivirga xinjiangensis]|uniref:glycosyltransferase family 2 protein n=1 Tax=Desertivirga xinjiangensis TaxID=539206 RepID=UPI00210ABD29|nr:glycosyltransferase family 2 protein [Pedobacter xinjiangensis]